MSARDEILRHPGVLATADAEIGALLDKHRVEVLREEATRLRRVEREMPHGAHGARMGVLKAALVLDEDADLLASASAPTPPACAACRVPFDPTGWRHDDRARYRDTPFCRSCVDRCHESTDAFHRCAVCRTAEEKTTAAAAAVTPEVAPGTSEDWCTGCFSDHNPEECGYRPKPGKQLAEADAGRVATTPRHIGRHWHGHDIEDACPCPKAPCGLVVEGTAVPECTQHPAARSQTIRQSHLATACPAAEQPLTGRQSKLLAAVEADPGRWGTTRAERLYRVWGVQHARRSARRDLAQLCELGHLYRVGPDHAIRYQLRKDGGR